MKRRTVLGGLAAVATAGCISNASGDDSGSTDVRLARLSVKNEDTRSHTLHVLVKRGGEIVHWSSHDLASSGSGAGNTATLSCTWGDASGRFEILARLDDASEWRSTIIAADQSDCYQASVEIGGDGALGVWYTTDCDVPEADACDVPTTTTDAST